MANITVNSSRNFDDATSLALNDKETITINSGAVLTIDSDNRWSQNAACPLNVTIDSSSGGEFFLEGRNVWWVPFDASTGTVPALGSYGTQNVTRGGSSVGEFLGVWTALGVAPSASGGAMPASGWIKLRSRSAELTDNDVLTIGTCTVTLSGAGQRGWLNVVGVEGGTITIPRLGKWWARGDWFDLGVTSGSRNQVLQYFVADYCPALWIETSPGSGEYEIWLSAGNGWSATYISMDERGKFFGCTEAGVITIAATGYGKLPAAGCKIRVPNIHISSTSSASSYQLNTFHATSISRWEPNTSASGTIDLEKVGMGGVYLNTVSPYALRLHYVSFLHQSALSNNATPIDFKEVAVGWCGATGVSSIYPFDWRGTSTGGGTVLDCVAVSQQAGALLYVIGFTGLSISGGRYTMLNRPVTNGAIRFESCVDLTIDGLDVIGSQAQLVNCTGASVKNLRTSDTTTGGTSTAVSTYALLVSGCVDTVIDGMSILPDGGTPPRNRYLKFSSVIDSKVRNLGAQGSPINLAGHTTYGISSGSSLRTKIQRCYFSNGLSGEYETFNTDNRLTFESCSGDLTGSSIPVTPGNSTIKGHYGGASGFGTSGIPTIISSTFGTHFYDTFISTTQGRIGVVFNEPTAVSGAYAEVTAGAVEFNASGSAILKDVGDQLTYTWPHYILGYTGLANVAPALNGANTGNLTVEYDLDKGSGFSSMWKTCNAANLSAETGIDPATGFKPKFRFTCAAAATTNRISGFYITGTTTSAAQTDNLYPLDVSTLTLTGFPTGTEIHAYLGANPETAIEIAGVEYSGATFSFTHTAGGSAGFITFVKRGLKFFKLPITYQTSDVSIPIFLDPDLGYNNPA